MKENKRLLLVIAFFAIIVTVSVIYFRSGYIDKHYKNLYREYGSESVSSTKNTFEVEHSLNYYYVGEEGTVNVKQLTGGKDLNLSFRSEDEEIVTIDENGNIKALREGKATIIIESDYDDYSTIEIVVVNPEEKTKDDAQKEQYESHKEEEKEKEENVIEEQPNEEEDESIFIDDPVPERTPEPTPVPSSEPEPTNTPVPSPTPDENPYKTFSGVENQLTPGYVPVTGITVHINGNSTYYPGDTLQLEASVVPENATKKDIFYLSSDNNVLTVSKTGYVRFLHAGKATVTVSAADRVSKTINYTVKSKELVHFISLGDVPKNNKTDHPHGDAILLESNGHYAMIDAGSTEEKGYTNVINYLKNHNVKELDFVLFTHMHSDHAGNLKYILNQKIKINTIYMKNYDTSLYRKNYVPNMKEGIDAGLANQVEDGNDYANLNKALSRFMRVLYLSKHVEKYNGLVGSISYIKGSSKPTVINFQNMKLELYNTALDTVNVMSNENYNSVLSLITVNNHKVFLTGDAYDTKQMNEIAASIGHVDVFKLPHHGSKQSALRAKRYSGNKVVSSGGTIVEQTSLKSFSPTFYIVTNSERKLENIRRALGLGAGEMTFDLIKNVSGNYKYFVDNFTNGVVIDLTEKNITVSGK